MAKRKTYKPEDLESFRARLERMKETPPPPSPEMSATEVIKDLMPEIRQAIDAGWAPEQIIESLNEDGLKITTSTFQKAVSGMKRTKKSGTKPRRTAAASSSSSDSNPEPSSARPSPTSKTSTEPKPRTSPRTSGNFVDQPDDDEVTKTISENGEHSCRTLNENGTGNWLKSQL